MFQDLPKASGIFNDEANAKIQAHEATMINDNMLMVFVDAPGIPHHKYCYDFLSRVVTLLVQTHSTDRVMLFSEMDPQVLEIHHRKLQELGGNPLPLPNTVEKPSRNPPGLRS